MKYSSVMRSTVLEVVSDETINTWADNALKAGLRDISEANPAWLKTAKEAWIYSFKNGGIMADFAQGHCSGTFYEALQMAIAAHRRHTGTNYEELLENGVERELARILKV